MTTPPIADGLRDWAAGSDRMEAATELLIRAFNGRFAHPGYPWIHTGHGRPWIEFDAITDDSTAVYSGGERRVLAIAAALGTRTHLDLAENITGLDRAHAHLVLAALAHTMGSHHHDTLRRHPDGSLDIVELGSLCPWPTSTPSARPIGDTETPHQIGLPDPARPSNRPGRRR